MTDHLETLREAFPWLWDGVLVTLQLSLGGAALAFLISVVLGLVSTTAQARETARRTAERFAVAAPAPAATPVR